MSQKVLHPDLYLQSSVDSYAEWIIRSSGLLKVECNLIETGRGLLLSEDPCINVLCVME